MGIDPQRLSTAISDVYAACLDQANRGLLPEKLAKAFDATSCLLHTRGAGDGVAILGATDNIKSLMPDYSRYYHSHDLWAVRAGAAHHIGHAIIGEELVPERELIDAEWYYDLCRPYGVHHIVGGVFEVQSGIQGQIGIHRSRDASAFEMHDRAMLDLLIPHLKQAYRLLRFSDRNARTNKLSFEVLGALSVCVFIVSGTGQVRLMNALAEKLIETYRVITVRNGRLQLSDPKLDNLLHECLRKTSLAPLGRSLTSGGTLALPTGDDERLLIMVMPLPPEMGSSSVVEPLAAVLVENPSLQAELSTELVRTLYGLTSAESRVLLAIAKGQSLPEYAREAAISINTAHSHAKSVFSKTGYRRQAELAAQVLQRPILRIARLLGR